MELEKDLQLERGQTEPRETAGDYFLRTGKLRRRKRMTDISRGTTEKIIAELLTATEHGFGKASVPMHALIDIVEASRDVLDGLERLARKCHR